MSDEKYIDSESDFIGTETPTQMASKSPPKEIPQQYVSRDADILDEDTNFEPFRNGYDTYQRYEAKPYNPQDVVYQEESLSMRDSAVPPLSWGLRLKICSDVARVMAFMHSQERPVILRDMHLAKVLLDESYNVKVSCFGLARFGPTGMESTHVSTRVMGTYGCVAPEYMLTGHLSMKSDVYSFGVILVEVLTGLPAMDAQHPTKQHRIDWTRASMSNTKKLRSIMDRCLEGKYSMGAALQTAQLALKCLSAEQRLRPSMREVLQVLEQIQSENKIT